MIGFRYYRLINMSVYSDVYVTSCINNFLDIDGQLKSIDGEPLASSQWRPELGPEKAFNNFNKDHLWHQGVPTRVGYKNEYIGYRTQTPYILAKIDYLCRYNETRQRWRSADVQCSEDGVTWIPYGKVTFNPSIIFEIQRVDVDSDYITLQYVKTKTNLINSFYNIGIYSSNREIRGQCLNAIKVSLYEKYTRKLIQISIVDKNDLFLFKGLDKNKSYYVVDDQHRIVYDTDYEGIESIKGFVEGVTEPVKVSLTDKHGNELGQQSTTDFEFKNYNIENLNGNIKIGDTLTPVEYYINQQRGYISASVVITECIDSDFVIHCFRSSDKQFIGEYPIIDDRYTIDNLNLIQTYDIMLYDKNKIVETQVHSRRTPSIYQ